MKGPFLKAPASLIGVIGTDQGLRGRLVPYASDKFECSFDGRVLTCLSLLNPSGPT